MPALISSLARTKSWLQTLWVVASLLLTLPILLPLALFFRSPTRPWVMGGHRGRIHADNCGALHNYLCANAGQLTPPIWIADSERLRRELTRRGQRVLKMHSVAARWHILIAPVLIYSHGESDLDLCMVLLRRVAGFRVYLNHSMNYLKAGQYHHPANEKLRGPALWLFRWIVTDFDLLLANSDLEARNFALSFPLHRDKIVLGGGAHLDDTLRGRETQAVGKIFYFPTFRESEHARKRLEAVVERLTTDPRLIAYLRRKGWSLCIGTHINAVEHLDPHSPIQRVGPAETIESLFTCDLFISDYSGLVFDYLALHKPIVHFPFDLDEYLDGRRLYVSVEELAYGPVAETVDELIDLVVADGWIPNDKHVARREHWRQQAIVHEEPVYCKTSLDTILDELARRAPHLSPPTLERPTSAATPKIRGI